MNTNLKVFYLFNVGQVFFFIHFWAIIYAQSAKRMNCCFLQVFMAKNQYGQHGEIGVLLYKWLYGLEMVELC